MTHLVDSDWVADWLKGRSEVVEFLASLGRGNLALYHDLTLITGNFRHFSRIPDLKIHR